MKNIHTNFMAEYILKLTGEYASANRIHDVLNLSLSYTYTLANNNKIICKKEIIMEVENEKYTHKFHG